MLLSLFSFQKGEEMKLIKRLIVLLSVIFLGVFGYFIIRDHKEEKKEKPEREYADLPKHSITDTFDEGGLTK